ncbi:DUF202 domain-containing protein [Lewinella cohaerens]|uniref:DUF202 domain-containing protein n=1 Tax=Lewinella cohaerens TaxID=70995 RepID=UPI000372C821|nr:DUF202 domain-containing protein [Lewinella cohaerens]
MAHLNNTDLLALERTKMANERTFLAYFRTFMVFLSSGFAVMKLEILHEIHSLGMALVILSPLVLMIGVYRLYRVRTFLKRIETKEGE